MVSTIWDTLKRYAEAHRAMFPVLERVAREISEKLGLGPG